MLARLLTSWSAHSPSQGVQRSGLGDEESRKAQHSLPAVAPHRILACPSAYNITNSGPCWDTCSYSFPGSWPCWIPHLTCRDTYRRARAPAAHTYSAWTRPLARDEERCHVLLKRSCIHLRFMNAGSLPWLVVVAFCAGNVCYFQSPRQVGFQTCWLGVATAAESKTACCRGPADHLQDIAVMGPLKLLGIPPCSITPSLVVPPYFHSTQSKTTVYCICKLRVQLAPLSVSTALILRTRHLCLRSQLLLLSAPTREYGATICYMLPFKQATWGDCTTSKIGLMAVRVIWVRIRHYACPLVFLRVETF